MKRAPQSDDCSPLVEGVARGEVSLVSLSRGRYPGERLSPGQLPGLRSVGCWDAVGPQSWGLPMHRNEGIEICYMLTGQCPFATDTGSWMLQAGDITITRPWQRHRVGNPCISACKLFWLILDVQAGDGRASWEFPPWIGPDGPSRRALLRVFRKNQCCHLVDTGGRLKGFMQQTCEQLNDAGPLTNAHLANAVNHLLLSVAQRLTGGIHDTGRDPHGLNQTIRQFFGGLEASVEKAAEPWTLDAMAHACLVGKSYLTASCRKMFNATPVELLNLIRLHHAGDLLVARPGRSITEVAFDVGFNSSQYFANRFKRQFGVTPAAYRLNRRESLSR